MADGAVKTLDITITRVCITPSPKNNYYRSPQQYNIMHARNLAINYEKGRRRKGFV